jgi:hypothetical protein
MPMGNRKGQVGGYPGGNPSGRLPGEKGEIDEAAGLAEAAEASADLAASPQPFSDQDYDPAHPDLAHEDPADETDRDEAPGRGPEVDPGDPDSIPDVGEGVTWPPGTGV